MTNSKGSEPLPAYLARVSSFFFNDFPMGYISLMIFPMGYITLLTNEEDGFQIWC